MLKVAILLKRDAGNSLETFKAQFEQHYTKILGGLLDRAAHCQRHYLKPAPYPLDGILADPAYDVLTEIRFADRARYEDALAGRCGGTTPLAARQPGLLDDSATRIAVIEERQSQLPSALSDQPKIIRLYALLKRKPGMSLENFIAYYETGHARLGERFVITMSSYRRLFLRPAAVPLNVPAAEAPYDVVTELAFPDEAALEAAGLAFSTLSTMETIAEDEAKFVDPVSRRLVSVETV